MTLAVIALAAFLCPLIAQSIPQKPIPETVFLLIAGMVCGPHVLGVIELSESVDLLSDLGLAFLFLLAGYEINPRSITGGQGRRGAVTWVATLAVGFAVVALWPAFSARYIDGIAVAIALTTTALGTLLPILQERNLLGTRVGDAILAYGTWGELGPIIAMALLLSTRASWLTVAILLLFTGVALLAGVLPKRARQAGGFVMRAVTRNANTNSQLLVRGVVVILVGLTALSAVFDLDIVLGSFAAGFIVRYIIPEGSELLEGKLNAIAFGFFIPLFFVVSGAKIDMMAVFAQPLLLVEFIVLLLLVRAVPIYVALSTDKQARDMVPRNRLTVALYCTTALPLIVAVTTVATDMGAMSYETSSVLVAAGGITVLLMPLLAQVTLHTADAEMGRALKEIAHEPRHVGQILKDHWELERMIARQNALDRIASRESLISENDLPWQDQAALLQRASERKRARDAALDEAAQRIAAQRDDDYEDFALKQSVLRHSLERHAARTEERRRRIAEHAIREYLRRTRDLR